jgi:osmotically-inducible protein OsmY
MKTLRPTIASFALFAVGMLVSCTSLTTKTPDVSGQLRTSLDSAGLKDVTSSQDREKGVVTLGGHVASDADKVKAESIAKSLAGSEVIANQIAVTPIGAESDAKAINQGIDKGIEGNLDAALIAAKLEKSVRYSVKNRVVTLTGDVKSEATRARSQQTAANIQNVDQVVNELQVREQKATSSN